MQNSIQHKNTLVSYEVIIKNNSNHFILFMHGFGCDSSIWQSIQENIKTSYNQILIDFKQDKNLGYSIGHGTILNPRIENGEFKAILFDKYDFQWLNKEKLPNSETRKINNIAYFFKLFGKLKIIMLYSQT